ncbi:Protein kinase domain-containing protein [Psidium guajava]|nr:Protein kinase domain-containing protein [Psidium guajava]
MDLRLGKVAAGWERCGHLGDLGCECMENAPSCAYLRSWNERVGGWYCFCLDEDS